ALRFDGSRPPVLCIPFPMCAFALTPKAGAQCVSSARWDLRGGPPARGVPTAIRWNRYNSGWFGVRGRTPSGGICEGLSTDAGTLADPPVVAMIRLRIAVGWGAQGRGCPG